MRKKWIPCDFDCLHCKRADCDAPTTSVHGSRNGEMTKAIERSLKATESEIAANIYRLEHEITYYKKRKEQAQMNKEKFEKLSDEEKQRVRERQKEYYKKHREKILKQKERRKQEAATDAKEQALIAEKALQDAIDAVAEIKLPEGNITSEEEESLDAAPENLPAAKELADSIVKSG